MAKGRSRALLAVAAVVAVALLGAGGYVLQGKLKCDGLRDDFLNSADSMRTYTEAASFLERTGKDSANITSLRESSRRQMENSYLDLSRDCGDRAAGNAMREARALVGS